MEDGVVGVGIARMVGRGQELSTLATCSDLMSNDFSFPCFLLSFHDGRLAYGQAMER